MLDCGGKVTPPIIGRIKSMTDEEGTVTYTYDANGNLLTVTDENGTITRTYDNMNRVTTYTDYKGNTVEYGYDELGNRISLTYPGGEIVRYTYYKNGRLKTVTDWEGRVTAYEYDGVGNLIKTTHSNGVAEENTYNKVGNLVVRVQKKDEEVIERTEYTYDAAGNITAVSESDKDEKDRSVLKNAVMTYDADNRLLTYNGKEIRYDADGNMIYGPLNGVMTEFTYDSRNRLIRAGETTYEYDAENNRIAVETENYRDEYVLDVESTYSQMLIAERTYTDGRVEVSKYVYGNGLIGEEKTADETKEYATYLYNHLGSTTAVTDENGTVIETYDYGAYGELLTDNTGVRRFLYNGQLGVTTDDNGLYHMRARYYNTDIKRFISRDIVSGDITNSKSLNRYCYVQGNPLSYVDPFGLSPLSILCEIGHGVLMVLGFVPEWGFIADALNAIWYAAEKKPFEAFCSAVSAIPGAGDKFAAMVQVGKITGKVFKNTKLIKTISHLMGNIGSLCIAGVNVADSGDNLIKALKGEEYEGTILGNSIMFGLSILSGVLSTAGIIKKAKDLGNLVKPKLTIGSKGSVINKSGQSLRTSTAKLGHNVKISQSVSRNDIIKMLDGATDESSKIVSAIRDGKIRINVLGDELFEAYLGCSSKTTAMQVGNQIYMRGNSASIYSDVVHEGTHALDYINNIPQSQISSWVGEIKAYNAERVFQIQAGLPVEFMSEKDILVHVWKNYMR